MSYPWNDLRFWKSGEWQVVNENLQDLTKRGVIWNPPRKQLFRALSLVPYDQVKVVILGQDPYPNHTHATGVAFSIPPDVPTQQYPPTLRTILNEYVTDLHYPFPKTGDLTPWCQQGVLLWNVIPSCTMGKPLSHQPHGYDDPWGGWRMLTEEILEKLLNKNIVIAALGSVAREYVKHLRDEFHIIEVGHPSPRGNLSSKSPFTGSRLFSTINAKLVEIGEQPLDWKLP